MKASSQRRDRADTTADAVDLTSGRLMRGDTERNINRLLEALETFDLNATELTMRQLASAAEVSPASAYRYFGSIDGVIDAFRVKVSKTFLDHSKTCGGSGRQLLESVCARWIELVRQHGKALTQLRSREGYLARLAADDAGLVMQRAALMPALHSTYAELGIPDIGDEGLFLWSQLFDPRGVMDLAESFDLSADEVTRRLVSTLLSALQGYASARGDKS